MLTLARNYSELESHVTFPDFSFHLLRRASKIEFLINERITMCKLRSVIRYQ